MVSAAGGIGDEDGEPVVAQGVYQRNTGMKPPKPRPGMLTQEMAEAAAVQFKKRQPEIQKACAALDDPSKTPQPKQEKPTEQGCSCVIL